MEIIKKSCCVFGHRKISDKENLEVKLTEIIENLIVSENVDTFYLGSRSEFDDLCRQILSEIIKKYPHITRVYIRAEYPEINEDYEKFLLEKCEKTYFSKRAGKAGKGKYIERNYEMIDNSDICIVYLKDGYLPSKQKNGLADYQPASGTKTAYDYAKKKNKIIINVA